ncbi:MAG TPA: NAD(P)H-binding protein [Bryobacteraceae bacterium]
MTESRKVFVTGATGYIGSRLIPVLQSRGHRVTALTRESSKHKLTNGCNAVSGDALDGGSYRESLNGADTFIHLVGVSHPSPAKARQFVEIDMKSAQEAIRVAVEKRVGHFVYLSVAHPAPAMHAYINVRTRCEQTLKESGLNATILRPWYVLGPGHQWPYVLLPAYRVAELLPATRASALRLGLVRLPEMLQAMASVVSHPPDGVRVIEVPEIRRIGRNR